MGTLNNIMAASISISAILMGGNVSADFSPLAPITKTFSIEGQQTTLTIHPEITISGQAGAVKIDLSAIVDATDLQKKVEAAVNRSWKDEECGQRFRTHGAAVAPAAGGRLHVGLSAQAQLWECIKTKVPKTYFENKCIVKAFGKCQVKTKVPVVRWEMETAKTKLISQSVRLEALVSPVIRGDTISAHVDVTKAMPSGLAGDLTKIFGLHGTIKDLVQDEVKKKVNGFKFRLPAEVSAYNVVVHDADFINLGGGRLGLKVLASGTITQAQLVTLLNEQIGKIN